MANYAVTTQSTENGNLTALLASLQTLIQAVDATKTIRNVSVFWNSKSGKYEASFIYDT